jgi:2-methylisocitrate lyase-like PEP mutase family enzyme
MRTATKLRQLLSTGMVVAPGCYDVMSARLAQLAGFEAVHLTGLGAEGSLLGAPDLGLLTMTELAAHAARMSSAIDIPIMADIDTGFGGVLNVGRTIREMERAGVAGVHIEDQANPKHCPLLAGRTVVSRAEAVDRLKAALDARTDPDLVIVARTDADTISFEELIERANLYLEAGADMVMPIMMNVEGRSFFSISATDQMGWYRKLTAAINGPVMGMGSGPPIGYTVDDLADAGFALVLYSASPLGAAANAVAALFKEMKEAGTDAGYIAANPGPYHDPLNLLKAARLDHYVEIEKKYTAGL